MISDVLSEAVEDIESYLNDPDYADVYEAEIRTEINDRRDRMQAIRIKLDAPPQQ